MELAAAIPDDVLDDDDIRSRRLIILAQGRFTYELPCACCEKSVIVSAAEFERYDSTVCEDCVRKMH